MRSMNPVAQSIDSKLSLPRSLGGWRDHIRLTEGTVISVQRLIYLAQHLCFRPIARLSCGLGDRVGHQTGLANDMECS